MRETLRFALLKTIPVLLGYLFLGIAFGVVLQRSGYGLPWALLSSTVIYAGSGQFVMADLLAAGAGLLTVAVTTLLVNSRHIFYGLTFIERFRGMKTRPDMILSLTDETYSLLCALETPDGIDENRAMFLIALLDQCYWILGGCIGALLGQALPVDLTGIDFAMTALFTVILVEQVRRSGNRLPALIGGLSALLMLVLLGPDAFLLPSPLVTVTLLVAGRALTARREADA